MKIDTSTSFPAYSSDILLKLCLQCLRVLYFFHFNSSFSYTSHNSTQFYSFHCRNNFFQLCLPRKVTGVIDHVILYWKKADINNNILKNSYMKVKFHAEYQMNKMDFTCRLKAFLFNNLPLVSCAIVYFIPALVSRLRETVFFYFSDFSYFILEQVLFQYVCFVLLKLRSKGIINGEHLFICHLHDMVLKLRR